MRGIIAATLVIEAENDIRARDIALYGGFSEVDIISIDPLDHNIYEVQIEIDTTEDV